jgi:Fe-S-cluster containining protein
MSVDSSIKLLDYINKVAKEPIYLNGEPFGTPPPTMVTLSDTFFWKDDCVMCGRCCVNESNVWTQEGMDFMKSVKDDEFIKWGLDPKVRLELNKNIQEKLVEINGRKVLFYYRPSDNKKDAQRLSWPDRKETTRCHWLMERDGNYVCSIHPVRSITCGMPHLRFMHNQSMHHTILRVMQYGRNWALKCPVEFGPYDEQSTQVRIKWLKRLYNASKDLGIDTWLPEILEYLDAGNRTAKRFYAEKKKKLFEIRR